MRGSERWRQILKERIENEKLRKIKGGEGVRLGHRLKEGWE
jgi:hypothetical protein